MFTFLQQRQRPHANYRHAGARRNPTAVMPAHAGIQYSFAAPLRVKKSLKNWQRQWKLDLIERTNPRWEARYSGVL
ncbi:MAG: hypothetical protein HYX63_11665 [Gammaproteobacteria bacterium]|nr:hypothetical protein [Gammaproteobacteria bacterium]